MSAPLEPAKLRVLIEDGKKSEKGRLRLRNYLETRAIEIALTFELRRGFEDALRITIEHDCVFRQVPGASGLWELWDDYNGSVLGRGETQIDAYLDYKAKDL